MLLNWSLIRQPCNDYFSLVRVLMIVSTMSCMFLFLRRSLCWQCLQEFCPAEKVLYVQTIFFWIDQRTTVPCRDELLSVCVYKKDINLKLSTHIVVRVALAAFVCSCFFDCIFRVCFLLSPNQPYDLYRVPCVRLLCSVKLNQFFIECSLCYEVF